MTIGTSFFGSWQITLSLGIFLAALAGVGLYGVAKKLVSLFEFLAVLSFIFLFSVIALLGQQHFFLQMISSSKFNSDSQELSSSGILWVSIFNVAVFFELLGLIFSGYSRRETWLVNVGAFFLFLLIIVKYFDWFFTFLDKSIFFIGTGILLFAVGWFMEKGRRLMVSNIKARTENIPR